jgi:hypothetical protein
MTRYLSVVFVLLLPFAVLNGQSVVKDPIENFLEFKKPAEGGVYADLQTLYVLDLDINNDGAPVRFISFNGNGGKSGSFWQAYVPDPGGYAPVDDTDDTFYFSRDTFYVGRIKETGQYGLLAYIPGRGGGDLELYRIVNNKVVKTEIGTLDLSNEADVEEFAKYFGSAPDWKGPKQHPERDLTLDDLRSQGYNVDEAIKNATRALSSSTNTPPTPSAMANTVSPMPSAVPTLANPTIPSGTSSPTVTPFTVETKLPGQSTGLLIAGGLLVILIIGGIFAWKRRSR